MTRSLAVLFLSLLPVIAYAESDLRVLAYAGEAPSRSPFEARAEFIVINDGPEVSGPIRLRITFPEPLRFGGLTTFTQSFTCASEGSSVLCTGPALGPQHGDSETFTIAGDAVPAGRYTIDFVLETENDPNPGNNRFVAPLTVTCNFDVTTDADSGPGSLRDAIEQANAHCRNGIQCYIIGPRFGDFIIRLQSPLPVITACNLRIDAGSTSIYYGHRSIELDGSALQAGNGFEVRSACRAGVFGVTITGFAIGGFPGNGILLATQDENPVGGPGGTWHAIGENMIGIDRLGTQPRPNGLRGIAVESPRTLASIYLNDIGANRHSGIAVWASAPGTGIYQNHIGWGRWNAPVPNGNGASGIYIAADDVNVEGNNIAFNGHFGVGIARGVQRAGVRLNTIHSNGEPAIDWGLDRNTPNDFDETDGIPNAPRITGMTSDGRISGLLRSRTGVYGTRFRVNLYVNGGPGLTGRFEAFQFLTQVDVQPNADGVFEVPFETRDFSYLHGQTVTAQLVVLNDTETSAWTSELSAPFRIP